MHLQSAIMGYAIFTFTVYIKLRQSLLMVCPPSITLLRMNSFLILELG